MDRYDEAMQISKDIQKSIDKLKNLNFSVDSRYEGIFVFDNEIEPEKTGDAWMGYDKDFGNQIIFSFNLYIHP